MNRLRLRTQLALVTFVPLVIFALLAGAIGAYGLRKIPENLVLERQTALAQVAAAGVAGTLRGYVRLLEAAASELAEHVDDPVRQQEVVARRSLALGAFSGGARLLNVQGMAIAATAPADGSLGMTYAERDYFRECRDNLAPVFSTAIRDRPTGQAAVLIAVPVRRGGEFAGALLGEFTLGVPEWARDLNLLRTPQGGRAYVIDSLSTIIFHPDPELVDTTVQSDPDLWQLVAGGQPRSALLRAPQSGQLAVVTYAPIPGIAWGLLVEEPWDVVLASIASVEGAFIILLALGIGLAALALAFSVNRVTRPLAALVSAGRRVAAGEPYRTLPPTGPADLRVLVQVVNQMAVHLGEQQAALRRYARQVVQGQEEERLRLSRDLHDETVQELVALTQRIELGVDALDDNPAEARRRLREARALARRTLAGVRRISQNLRPSILEDLGLVPALQLLARDLGEEMPEARVEFELLGEEVALPRHLQLTAFRIAQESLTNVRKHARTATRVSVALVFEGDKATLVIEDNGPGFNQVDSQTLVSAGHLGLAGMAERARLFGGQLGIESAPGEGTTITLRLPLSEEQSGTE